jgi:hypothetical protein
MVNSKEKHQKLLIGPIERFDCPRSPMGVSLSAWGESGGEFLVGTGLEF